MLTRPAPPPDFSVRYGDHPDHVADVRVGGPSLVIFLHGGFWRSEYDRGHVGPLAAALAAEGVTVATPEYRRTGAPGGGWPATLDDVAAAVAAVPSLVAEHIGAVGPVVLAGHSAGGHLALWAASQGAATRGAGPQGVVALAPVTDLRRAYELDLDGGAVLALLGGGPDEVPERYTAATPAVPPSVPTTLIHGDRDEQVPLEFSQLFVRRAEQAGGGATLVQLPDTDHFALIDPQSRAWSAVLRAVRAALGLESRFDDGQDSG